MGKDLGDLIVRLSLDSGKFDDGLKRMETQLSKVQSQFQSSTTGLTDFGKVTEKLQGSAATLTERLGLQKEKVAQLEKTYEESVRTKGADAEETQRLAKKLDEAKAAVARTEKALEAVNAQIKLNQNGWYQLGVNLENVGKKLEQVGKKITNTGKALSKTITAPIVGLGTACVKTFTTFDDSMRTVEATMGLVAGSSSEADASIEKLRATAKEMGATTRFTASQAADALNYLALAGYDTDKACATLPTILDLAAAGAMDLAKASDMVTDAMSALGIRADKEGKNVTRFADELAVTAQKSNTNIEQLGEAILAVGATARNLAGGTVELNTALGIFADNGIKGAEGGTKLRNVILAMTPTTKAAKEAFKKLKIESYDLSGKLRPLEQTFGDINKAMRGMTDKQKTEWLNKVFNKQDLKAVGALLAATATSVEDLSFALSQGELELDIKPDKLNEFVKALGKTGGEVKVLESLMNDYGLTNEQAASALADLNGVMDGSSTRFNELAGYIGDCDGATRQMSDTMEGGIGGSFRSMMSAVEGLAIAFGERLAPHVKAAADKVTEFTRKLTEMNPKTLDTIIKVAALAAAIGPLLIITGKLVTSVGSIMRVLSPLAKAMGGSKAATGLLAKAFALLTGPVGIVLAAIAALVGVFVLLYKTNEDFRNKVNAIWAQICATFENVKAVFQRSLAALKEAFAPVTESVGALWEKVQEVFGQITPFLEGVLTGIGAVLGGLIALVVSVVGGIVNAIAPIVQAVTYAVDVITSILGTLSVLLRGDATGAWACVGNAIVAFGAMVDSVLSAVVAFFVGCWESLCTIAQGFGVDLNVLFTEVWSAIQTGVTTAWDAVSAWLSTTWNSIAATASMAWNTVCTNVSSAISSAQAGIESAWTTITGAISSVWGTFSGTATSAWNTICNNVNTAITSAQAGIQSAWTTITTAINTGWTTFAGTATSAWNTITSNINTAITSAKSKLETAWTTIATAIHTGWTTFAGTATSSWNTITTNVRTAVTSAQAGVQTAWTTITMAIQTRWTTFASTATTSWTTITTSVKTAVSGAQSGIVSAWDSIKTAIKTTWDGVTSIFQSPINSAISWLESKVAWMKNLFNFTWKLPDFKLPKINVDWKDVGWGIKIPNLSLSWNALGGIFNRPTIFSTANAGLQGVGEAGPEAILPLKTLWAEMSLRLKHGMREIMAEANGAQRMREEQLMRSLLEVLREDQPDKPRGGIPVNVTQNIYATDTSYAGQQREAARQFRQIARAMS